MAQANIDAIETARKAVVDAEHRLHRTIIENLPAGARVAYRDYTRKSAGTIENHAQEVLYVRRDDGELVSILAAQVSAVETPNQQPPKGTPVKE